MKKYARILQDDPLATASTRRLLYILRLCFYAKTNGATFDTILDEIETLHLKFVKK